MSGTTTKQGIKWQISISNDFEYINGLNAPKDIWSQNKLKNKTHLYAAHRKLILDLMTSADWKWEVGETFIMQMDVKRNPRYIGQNRQRL